MRLVLLSLLLLTPAAAFAHGGGLNAEGCHNNRKSGDYHCHRAPSVQREAPKRAPAPAAPSRLVPDAPGSASTAPNPGGPTCYVGPRGGTYTITPSGRKNYSGC